MSASKAEILEAVKLLASQSEGGLEKKPNVEEIKAIVEGDLTAADRDAAWAEFEAKSDDESEGKPEGKPEDAAPSDAVVTNNFSSALSIKGITIAPGQSAEVPDFDSENAVMKKWLIAEVISVT